MAGIQRRKGPNVIGYLGSLQPLADGLECFVKEIVLPTNANIVIFVLAPLITSIAAEHVNKSCGLRGRFKGDSAGPYGCSNFLLHSVQRQT